MGIRPRDNGALCGGAPFETKGCAENDCGKSDVNNGGSDGFGSIGVTIENVRLNDYYYAEDQRKLGVRPEPCCSQNSEGCLFCHANNIRSTQVGIWVPDTRNDEGTRNLLVQNVVSRSGQADAINLHGNVHDALVQSAYMENTGDDGFALWGANKNPTNITFKLCSAINPGITRPGWYGNCGATYGLQSVVFENILCKAPALAKRAGPNDDTMFAFFRSFTASYPEGSTIEIKGWKFQDLEGNTYTPSMGVMNVTGTGKMTWTRTEGGVVAPYWLANGYIPAQISATQSQSATRSIIV